MLAQLARSGDREAFARLYRLTAPKLFGFALRILRRRDLAEEALQEAFVSIWRHAGEFKPEKALPQTWLAAIVRNRALDLLRSRRPEDPLDDDEQMEALPSEFPDPLQKTLASREARALLECLDQLPGKQRQVILLSYFHGLSHAELAQRVAEPLGTVKTWIRRGLESLKRCLEK